MKSNNSCHKLCWFYVVVVGFTFLVKGEHSENDDWFLRKAEEARKTALDSYHQEPGKVTDEFNFHVRKALEGTNSTRRNLGWKSGYTGPCEGTNPIDRCWRCRVNWAEKRKKLAKCAKGFGRGATGGLAGRYYIVSDASDDDVVEPRPGTLRHAVIQEEPLWIIFNRSMIIKLQQELIIQSDKTIDGRGANVHIAGGAGIMIQFVKNIIIHGLHIHDIKAKGGGIIRDSVNHFGERTPSDGDGISIFGSSHIWLDHLSMRNCQDGLIDAISGSTAITISNSHFTDHNESLLFGARDEHVVDSVMQITLAFNNFGKGLIQRMPRCRRGFFHVVNNDYTYWEMYAIGGSASPTIISQGNRFIAPPNPQYREITHRNFATEDEWKHWTWRSEGDLMLNGAFFVESGMPLKKIYGRLDMIKAKPGSFVRRLTRFAGALGCRAGVKC